MLVRGTQTGNIIKVQSESSPIFTSHTVYPSITKHDSAPDYSSPASPQSRASTYSATLPSFHADSVACQMTHPAQKAVNSMVEVADTHNHPSVPSPQLVADVAMHHDSTVALQASMRVPWQWQVAYHPERRSSLQRRPVPWCSLIRTVWWLGVCGGDRRTQGRLSQRGRLHRQQHRLLWRQYCSWILVGLLISLSLLLVWTLSLSVVLPRLSI